MCRRPRRNHAPGFKAKVGAGGDQGRSKEPFQNIPSAIKFISYEPALGPLRSPKYGPYPDWLISGGESGPGARALDPQWVRDIIADCRRRGVAPFHKQWGSYASNPLVAERGLTLDEAKRMDRYGKGGGLLDGKLVREFPPPIQ
jgi:protein gp37